MNLYKRYAVPLVIIILIGFDAYYTGVNPYNIPPPLGWIQDSSSPQGAHCSFAIK